MKTEDLKSLYEKAYAYAKEKSGMKNVEDIIIEEDGSIRAACSEYIGCGEYNNQSIYFKVEDLN